MTVVDLPTPGAPVSPTMCARPVSGADSLHDHRQHWRGILDPADQAAQCPRTAQPDSSDDVAYVVTVEGQARPTQPELPSAGTVMVKATPERSDAAAMA